ncbi:hypothetical protein KSP40_PGU012980 [Platanthera guangdongensis]|uniref:Uncharacterized protein n=1 Tax=Platanthera guangdongensis TaxID=2320717 RepID=A0ABR2MKI3_9ASPA
MRNAKKARSEPIEVVQYSLINKHQIQPGGAYPIRRCAMPCFGVNDETPPPLSKLSIHDLALELASTVTLSPSLAPDSTVIPMMQAPGQVPFRVGQCKPLTFLFNDPLGWRPSQSRHYQGKEDSASFGSLIGFFPYRNLSTKWKFLAFESWLKKKGLDPSLHRQNLSIMGNYKGWNENPTIDSNQNLKKDKEMSLSDMKFDELLEAYEEEKTKYLTSFVGQTTRWKVHTTILLRPPSTRFPQAVSVALDLHFLLLIAASHVRHLPPTCLALWLAFPPPASSALLQPFLSLKPTAGSLPASLPRSAVTNIPSPSSNSRFLLLKASNCLLFLRQLIFSLRQPSSLSSWPGFARGTHRVSYPLLPGLGFGFLVVRDCSGFFSEPNLRQVPASRSLSYRRVSLLYENWYTNISDFLARILFYLLTFCFNVLMLFLSYFRICLSICNCAVYYPEPDLRQVSSFASIVSPRQDGWIPRHIVVAASVCHVVGTRASLGYIEKILHLDWRRVRFSCHDVSGLGDGQWEWSLRCVGQPHTDLRFAAGLFLVSGGMARSDVYRAGAQELLRSWRQSGGGPLAALISPSPSSLASCLLSRQCRTKIIKNFTSKTEEGGSVLLELAFFSGCRGLGSPSLCRAEPACPDSLPHAELCFSVRLFLILGGIARSGV